MKVYGIAGELFIDRLTPYTLVSINITDVVLLDWDDNRIGIYDNDTERTYSEEWISITDINGVALGSTEQEVRDAIALIIDVKGVDLEWVINFTAINNKASVLVTEENKGVLISENLTNIGSLTYSVDNVAFIPFSLPFTPIVGTTYYFERSDLTQSGVVVLNGYADAIFDYDNSLNDILINKLLDINGLSASPLLSSTYWGVDQINTLGEIRTNGYGGLLCSGGVGVNIEVVLPYMVVIGDSISEGHPALHGRLHPSGSNSYNPNYVSQAGQLSYELAQHWNIPILNQGIGGQTTQNVRDRWSRDVLAIDTNVGDGRGNRTLDFRGQKPTAVYLHCGINDIWLGKTFQEIKDNFTFFAQSCTANNIELIVSNIGVHLSYDTQKQNLAIAINSWLIGDFKTSNPNVVIIDYLNWSSDGTNIYNHLKPNSFSDAVHPNGAGYTDYANYIASHTNLPLNVDELNLTYQLSTVGTKPNKFSRITDFTLNGDTYNITTNPSATVTLANLLNKDDPTYNISVLGVAVVTGSAGQSGRYTGLSNLSAKLKS